MDHHLLPASSPAGYFESVRPYIPDGCCPDGTAPHEWRDRPLRSTTLVRVPGDAGFMSIAMLHLYQLHAARSHRSSLTGAAGALADEDTDTLQDMCQNYHELAVLARSQWLRANSILPFHLGALEIMDRALRGSFSPKA
jgi:mediator of RNA polymerase II transcription subunit 13